MNWLVDAQLPRRVALLLQGQGHDAIHTLDLPDGNRTTDAVICATAAREGRVVITKDGDFVQSFLTRRQPPRLLLVATGNCTNRELETLLLGQLPALVAAFGDGDFIELTQTALIVHLRAGDTR